MVLLGFEDTRYEVYIMGRGQKLDPAPQLPCTIMYFTTTLEAAECAKRAVLRAVRYSGPLPKTPDLAVLLEWSTYLLIGDKKTPLSCITEIDANPQPSYEDLLYWNKRLGSV